VTGNMSKVLRTLGTWYVAKPAWAVYTMASGGGTITGGVVSAVMKMTKMNF
jgi:hypothetical protein